MSSRSSLRAVYILSASNAVFTFGYGMYAYIFPNFLKSVNATPPQVGLVSTIIAASMAITYIPGGILSDIGHRRKLVIASWLLPVFGPPFFILAQLTDSWLNAIPGAIVFASSWIGVPAVQSYTSEAAPTGKRGLSFGILVSSGSIGLVPSPLIGGVVFDAYGFGALFLIAFILYSTSIVLVLTIPRLPGDSCDKNDLETGHPVTWQKINEMRITGRGEARKFAVGVGNGSRVKQGTLRRLAPLLVLSCFLMGFVYIGWSYIPLYLSEEYKFSLPQVQLMYAISNLSSIVIVNSLGKLSDKYSPANRLALVTIPIVSLILGYWVLIHTSDFAALSVCFVLLGSVGSVFPLIYSVVAELSVDKRVGRTYGVIGMFIYAAEATTPYLGGTLFAASGNLPFVLTLILSPLLFVAVYIAHIRTH